MRKKRENRLAELSREKVLTTNSDTAATMKAEHWFLIFLQVTTGKSNNTLTQLCNAQKLSQTCLMYYPNHDNSALFHLPRLNARVFFLRFLQMIFWLQLQMLTRTFDEPTFSLILWMHWSSLFSTVKVPLHPAISYRKFFRIIFPFTVRLTSGWNCAP